MAQLARDIMSPGVISVPVTMDLRDLSRLFLEKGITGAPVVDREGRLAGVISQTDLVYYHMTRGDELVIDSAFYQAARVEGRHLPAGFQIEDFNSGVVGDVMTPLVHAVAEDATVDAVARLMTRKHIHRVIVRRGRRAVGIISALDVLKAIIGPAPKPKPETKPKTKPKTKPGSKTTRTLAGRPARATKPSARRAER